MEKVLEIEDQVEYMKEASQEWSSGRTRETGLMGSSEGRLTSVSGT